MSRRLRRLLREEWLAAGQPEPAVPVLPGFAPRTYEKRFVRLLAVAGLEGHTPQCLRHTFASMLLTAGIPLPFIALQLGHSSTVVTATHYAKWLARGYRAPLVPEPSEVAADLLARLIAADSPQSPPNELVRDIANGDEESRKTSWIR